MESQESGPSGLADLHIEATRILKLNGYDRHGRAIPMTKQERAERFLQDKFEKEITKCPLRGAGRRRF